MLFASLFYPRENEDCGVIEDVVDISYSHLNVVCSLNEYIDRLLNDALFFVFSHLFTSLLLMIVIVVVQISC